MLQTLAICRFMLKKLKTHPDTLVIELASHFALVMVLFDYDSLMRSYLSVEDVKTGNTVAYPFRFSPGEVFELEDQIKDLYQAYNETADE